MAINTDPTGSDICSTLPLDIASIGKSTGSADPTTKGSPPQGKFYKSFCADTSPKNHQMYGTFVNRMNQAKPKVLMQEQLNRRKIPQNIGVGLNYHTMASPMRN